jgi:hypothetical protein
MATAATATAARLRRNPNLNFGTVIDQLGGIQVGTGIVLINLDTDRRFHNIRLQCTAVNYTGGATLAPVIISGTAVNTPSTDTVNLTVDAFGVPQTATWVGTAGTNYTAGDKISVVDATGAGLILNVVSVSGSLGYPTALAIVSVGTPTAISAGALFGTVQLLVNGSPCGDISAQQELNRALFNGGLTITTGQFPIYFTEPWRNFTRWPAITSWDMAGQSTFAIKIAINPGYQQVNVSGTYEYDFVRNTTQGEIDQQTYQAALAAGKAPAPVLHIIARHVFTPTLNAGVNILTGQQIPFNWPILRMHCLGSTKGDLTQSILVTDNLTAESGFIGHGLDQLTEVLIERIQGFDTSIFDYSYVADKGQRISDCLKIASSLKWSLYSTISQGLTIIQERLQSRYE